MPDQGTPDVTESEQRKELLNALLATTAPAKQMRAEPRQENYPGRHPIDTKGSRSS